MAKKRKPHAEVVTEVPAELPEPQPEPEPDHEPTAVADAVDPAAEAPDHTAVHGADSIVDDERAYHIWRGGQRYVHVGEHAGQWVYRLD